MSHNTNAAFNVEGLFSPFPVQEMPQQYDSRNEERKDAGSAVLQRRAREDQPRTFISSISGRNSNSRVPSCIGTYEIRNPNGNFAADASEMTASLEGSDNPSNIWTKTFEQDSRNYVNDYGSQSLLSPVETEVASSSNNFFNSRRTYDNYSFDTTSEEYLNGIKFDGRIKLENDFDDKSDTVGSLKLQLQIKETQNECLEKEIQKFKAIFNQGLNYKQMESRYEKQNAQNSSKEIEIPHNLELIFRNLSGMLHRKDEELLETKQALEAVLTALALDPSNSVTKYGRYDAENISHKMVVRLETLTNENMEMSRMLAYGRSKETHIELQIARKEINELKNKNYELSQMLKDVSSTASRTSN